MKKIGIVGVAGIILGVIMVLFLGFTNFKTEPSMLQINFFLAGEIIVLVGSILLIISFLAEREELKNFKDFLKDFFF